MVVRRQNANPVGRARHTNCRPPKLSSSILPPHHPQTRTLSPRSARVNRSTQWKVTPSIEGFLTEAASADSSPAARTPSARLAYPLFPGRLLSKRDIIQL